MSKRMTNAPMEPNVAVAERRDTDPRKFKKPKPLSLPGSILESTPEEFASLRCTDDANGDRFAEHYGEKAKHSKTHGWLVYDGKCWKRDPKAARALAQGLPSIVRREVQTLCNSIDLQGNDALRKFEGFTAALQKHAKYTGSSKGIDATLREAAVKEGVMADDIEFDSDVYLLNCSNCTIDLRTGAAREHRSEDYITKLSPVKFNPDAQCPRWNKFLDEVFQGDNELIEYVNWLIGYSLTGSVEHQIFFVFHGQGQNGKGVLMRTIWNILGEDYAMEMNPEEIMVQHNPRHETGLAALTGVRFVSISETDEGRRINAALVKKLSGGDRIRARFMRQDGFEFDPQFKMCLATNYRPVIQDDTFGMWRRIRLIPFDRTFDGSEKDSRLEITLRDELQGILAQAVKVARESHTEPFVPRRVKAAISEYRAESDELASFLEDCTVSLESAKTPKEDLFMAFHKYSVGNCEEKKTFNARLKQRGFIEVRTSLARCWQGIALKPECRAAQPPGAVLDASSAA